MQIEITKKMHANGSFGFNAPNRGGKPVLVINVYTVRRGDTVLGRALTRGAAEAIARMANGENE